MISQVSLAFTFTPFRWAWQSIPVLQLPPVQTIGAVGSVGSTNEGSSKSRPRSLMAKVESRVFQLKEDNGVESALRAAEEILRQRRRWEDLAIAFSCTYETVNACLVSQPSH